jgi:hypothetical protein
MSYERTIDLMDETIFPGESLYAQKKNPKTEISKRISPEDQTDEEIAEFVINEMSDTLGEPCAP